jgi:hypothetical protein
LDIKHKVYALSDVHTEERRSLLGQYNFRAKGDEE